MKSKQTKKNKRQPNDPQELIGALATKMPGVEIKKGNASTVLEFPDETMAETFVAETLETIPIMKYLSVSQSGEKVTIKVPPLVRSMIKRKGAGSISDYLPVTITE